MNKLTPNPENASSEELEQALHSTADNKLHHRLLTLNALLKGHPPELVADIMNVSMRTLYNWVKRWNESGIDGLPNKDKCGRPPKLSAEKLKKIVELVENPDIANECHWTAIKLHGYLKKNEAIELGYSSLTRLLHKKGFALKRPRPWPVGQDVEKRRQFVEDLNNLLSEGDLEVWFCDESGFLADPRPRRIWAKKGTVPTTPATGLHLRESVIGAVYPESGELTALVVRSVDTNVFQAFINMFAEQTKDRNIVLVIDNASWHKSKSLDWHHIKPIYLPPYSPDLNPIERLWRVVKDRHFTQWYTKDRETLIQRICEALMAFIDNPDSVKTVCAV